MLSSHALVILAALFFVSCASPRADTSRLVTLGPKRSFFILEPRSPLTAKLDYGTAPISDTADPLHRGYGADVIAFRFDRAGRLSAPPAYIAQLQPEPRYLQRLRLLTVGRSQWREVEALFGPSNQRISQPGGGLLVYHEIPIYNSLEENFSTGAH